MIIKKYQLNIPKQDTNELLRAFEKIILQNKKLHFGYELSINKEKNFWSLFFDHLNNPSSTLSSELRIYFLIDTPHTITLNFIPKNMIIDYFLNLLILIVGAVLMGIRGKDLSIALIFASLGIGFFTLLHYLPCHKRILQIKNDLIKLSESVMDASPPSESQPSPE
jgi:hypothetical protein